MERVAYQNLRFEIEAQISCALDDPGVDREACINSLSVPSSLHWHRKRSSVSRVKRIF